MSINIKTMGNVELVPRGKVYRTSTQRADSIGISAHSVRDYEGKSVIGMDVLVRMEHDIEANATDMGMHGELLIQLPNRKHIETPMTAFIKEAMTRMDNGSVSRDELIKLLKRDTGIPGDLKPIERNAVIPEMKEEHIPKIVDITMNKLHEHTRHGNIERTVNETTDEIKDAFPEVEHKSLDIAVQAISSVVCHSIGARDLQNQMLSIGSRYDNTIAKRFVKKLDMPGMSGDLQIRFKSLRVGDDIHREIVKKLYEGC